MWATPYDVVARWRPLSPVELETASALIEDAMDVILSLFPDIQQRIDDESLPAVRVRRIVAGMVKRSMISAATDGISQQSQTSGPFSLSNTYANPTGNLYLTGDEREALSAASSRKVHNGWAL